MGWGGRWGGAPHTAHQTTLTHLLLKLIRRDRREWWRLLAEVRVCVELDGNKTPRFLSAPSCLQEIRKVRGGSAEDDRRA